MSAIDHSFSLVIFLGLFVRRFKEQIGRLEELLALPKSLMLIYDGSGGEALNWRRSCLGEPLHTAHVEEWPESSAAGAHERFTRYYSKLERCDWHVWMVRIPLLTGHALRVMRKVGGNNEVSLAVHFQVVNDEDETAGVAG